VPPQSRGDTRGSGAAAGLEQRELVVRAPV
jgi:hypothetical protein